MKKLNEFVTSKLLNMCEERGVSFSFLAHNCGLNSNMLYSWKHGNSVPSLESLMFLCDYLGMTIFEFFKGFDDGQLTANQIEIVNAWAELDDLEKSTFLNIIRTGKHVRKQHKLVR